MGRVSHRGRKSSSCACPAAEPADASSSSSVRPQSACKKASSRSSAVCKTGESAPAAACRTQTVSVSSTAAERWSLQLTVWSNRAASNCATASHTAAWPGAQASMRSVRSTSFATTGSSSRARNTTSPCRRAFHSRRFIDTILYRLLVRFSALPLGELAQSA